MFTYILSAYSAPYQKLPRTIHTNPVYLLLMQNRILNIQHFMEKTEYIELIAKEIFSFLN